MNTPERSAQIEIRDLTMAYGANVIQSNLNFAINRGDIFRRGYIGASLWRCERIRHNNAGRTCRAAPFHPKGLRRLGWIGEELRPLQMTVNVHAP